jgi:hypothetical protein
MFSFILMSGGQARLKPSPGSFFTARHGLSLFATVPKEATQAK